MKTIILDGAAPVRCVNEAGEQHKKQEETTMKTYGIRYQNGGGDCVWTARTIGAEQVGRWVVFSPCDDGLGEGATRDEAIADAARAAGVTVEDFESDDNFEPVACEVGEDSILIGQVEEIPEARQ